MTIIGENLERVRKRVAAACLAAGRDPSAIQLLAVSKSVGAELVAQAVAAGQTAFGENYIQEALNKIALTAQLPIQWHCIGPIQSNKTRLVAENFAWVQSIDRLKIAQRLSEQRPAQLAPLQVCIQVNVDGGATKAGVMPDDALDLARQITALPRLTLRGLMSIPEPAPDFASACAVHGKAQALFAFLQQQGLALDTLSMGMSDDLEAAIAAGSTLVRVGSAIFGARATKA
jgi:pyridoxal phosphate enzyme (YggS family)